MDTKTIESLFTRQDGWILPKSGTIGRKAQNLLDNAAIIRECGFELAHPSLVIPHEYLDDCPTYFALDLINHFFPNTPRVGVSSNAPDEDFGKRKPGMFYSAAINHLDRPDCDNEVERVLYSYVIPSAKLRRQKLGLPEQGMCLLVRPFIDNVNRSGSISNFGDISLITFTNHARWGMDSMQKPTCGKTWIDAQGRLLRDKTNTYEEHPIIPELFDLVSRLPSLTDKGWEVEFLQTDKAGTETLYAMQTTPIEKKVRFEVKDTPKNIFGAREVVGFGEVLTKGIIYLPTVYDRESLIRLNEQHKGYCIVTEHTNISTDQTNIRRGNVLQYADNARAVIDISPMQSYKAGFGAHILQQFREEGVALAGYFTNELQQIIPDEHTDRLRAVETGTIYSPTGLRICADEFERKATVELTTEIKPFIPLRDAIATRIRVSITNSTHQNLL